MSTYSHLLIGDIDEKTVEPLLKELVALKDGETLILTICSGGGSTDVAYALIDLMLMSPARIVTMAAGIVGSAALDIFVAGDHRVALPSAMGLAHCASYDDVAVGHTRSIPSKLRAAELEEARGERLYLAKSRYKTSAELRKHLFGDQDVWLNAQGLMAHGLADEIAMTPKLPVSKKKGKK